MNEFYELSLRLVVAMILGALIGTERELRAKAAGFRTHFLVALGSALFCIVSQFASFCQGKEVSSLSSASSQHALNLASFSLFFAGEVLDIDAITGGFNLQAAWTTGYVVGQHIGE